MERKEFISLIGLTAGGLLFASCIESCKKENNGPEAANRQVDFTLDLTAYSNAALKNKGGYVVTNDVIVAYTLAGTYIAVSSVCTHQGSTVGYQASPNRFHCGTHGSTFNSSGSVINGPASVPLQEFKTALNGNSLRVYS